MLKTWLYTITPVLFVPSIVTGSPKQVKYLSAEVKGEEEEKKKYLKVLMRPVLARW